MILVDTHVVLWLALDITEVSVAALDAMAKGRVEGGLAIADVSLWEIAQAVDLRRVELETSLHEFLANVSDIYRVLPISERVAERGTQFSERFPRDPFDRIIGATAVVHGLQLVTRDVRMRASGEVSCVW